MSLPDDQTLPPEPPRLRRLRLLVSVLTVTMILGLIVIIGSIVITLTGSDGNPRLTLPESITIPEGETANAVTAGDNWHGVVTTRPDGSQMFHIFQNQSGDLIQSVPILVN